MRLRLLSSILCLLLIGLPAHGQEGSSPRTVRVTGEATTTVAPDQATVRFGIVSRAETAEEARRQNAEAAKEAMNAVRELGIAEGKMRMESLRLQPHREYDPKTERHEEQGYEATRQVVVEVVDLEQLPRLVTRVVQRGANRLAGIDYGLSDRTSVRNEALRTAAQNAHEKAQLLVSSLDTELGPVQQIREQSYGVDDPSPRIQMEYARSAQDDAAPEPDAYAAGEIEVRISVDVTFELQ